MTSEQMATLKDMRDRLAEVVAGIEPIDLPLLSGFKTSIWLAYEDLDNIVEDVGGLNEAEEIAANRLQS